MATINTFKDWWYANSDAVFKQAKATDNWWDAFETCWEAAQTIELQRCAQLSAHRLAWEAQVANASVNGSLKEFLEAAEAVRKVCAVDE